MRFTEKISMLNIEPISMPHICRPPNRLLLDTVDMQLKERFHQSGLKILEAGGSPPNWGAGHRSGLLNSSTHSNPLQRPQLF